MSSVLGNDVESKSSNNFYTKNSPIVGIVVTISPNFSLYNIAEKRKKLN